MEETILLDGMNVSYRVEGKGEPLVLIHGMAFPHEIWDTTIEQASKFFTVYAPDLPGFGRSDKPDIEYGLPFYVDFMKKYLDALKIDKCSLAGISLGGEVAAAFAAKFPERVGRLVIISAKGFSPLIKGLRKISVLGSPLYVFMFNNREMLKSYYESMFFDKGLITKELIDKEWARLRDPDYRKSLSKSSKYLSTVDLAFADMLKSIKAKTLIIWGNDDALLPLDDAYRFKDSIENSVLVILEKCGHVPAIEKKAEFNRRLLTFMSEIAMYYDEAS